ncbi:uncharacterized protein [Onthophagus taurus]|uniref:uncharacterized protein n=1 Tax=Onthophagus taurus TaxID=166361 RepID=UPI000C206CB3|nr:uncharacterized protein LOC111425875 [Onthophagus taurus]
MANSKCQECGCQCSRCVSNDHDVHLHVEIENLKQRLLERDNHILSMETNFLNEANKFPNGEMVAMREELLTWQDKYKRLYEAHRRVQRVNQGLEDKLLKLVDTSETDKSTLTKDVATLSHKLAEANYTIKKLTEDNERYKNDVALAIQFLQCKPGNFVSQKVDTLPNEVQAKVSSYLQGKRKPEEKKTPPEIKSIKVPIPTFPPTAMVYSIPKSPNPSKKLLEKEVENPPVDIVSAAIMAKVLQERERERANVKHCDTCTCSKSYKIVHHVTHHTVSTQTGDYKESTCLQCNVSLNANQTALKVVKNVESIKNKNVPIYVHDNTNQNIAKVQPNNFLADSKCANDVLKITKDVEEVVNVNNGLFNKITNDNDLIDFNSTPKNETIVHYNLNETNKMSRSKEKDVRRTIHHQLCDMASQAYEMESNKASVSDQYSFPNSENLKGPRYCSMRLQTGSKNILLDNTHNNIAPVLYTRHHEKKIKSEKIEQNSISSGENLNSTVSDTSFQNRRVAEWIENNNTDYSDISRSDSLKTTDNNDINKEKYVEMENNVKRFLFGESEFLKTVELGKQKYLSYQDHEKSSSNSHTETDI